MSVHTEFRNRMYYNQYMRFTEKILVALLSFSLSAGCATQMEKSVKDGIYSGASQGYGGTVEVNITIADQKITAVNVSAPYESQIVASSAVKLIPEAIVSSQSTIIDASSGATITSDAICAAVEDALQKADADMDQWKDGEPVSIRNPKKDITTDVVVVGGGTAGLSAALRLRQMGIDTTVIEKDDACGGVMKDLVSAVQIVSSRTKAEKETSETENPGNSEEDHEQSSREETEPAGTLEDDLAPYFVKESGMLEVFMEQLDGTMIWQEDDLGIPFEDELLETDPYHEAVVARYDTSANTVGELLGKEAEVSGARLLYSTAVISVEENSDGTVVHAKSADGTLYTVTCTYAIIATGTWDDSEYITINSKLNEDDAHKISQQNGYEYVNGNSILMATGYQPDDHTVIDLFDHLDGLLKYGGVIVNGDGERFVDETADRQTVSNAVISQQQDCYLVLSRKGYETFRSRLLKMELDGETKDLISSDEGKDIFFITSKGQINDVVPVGRVIQEYEQSLSQLSLNDGYEDAFGRNSFKGNLSLENGIVLIRLSVFSTGNTGGLSVDNSFHALRADGAVSEHVFAAGSVCGNVLKEQDAPGLRTAWAFVSGKTVADEIGSVLAEDQLNKLLEKETEK